MLHAWLNPAAWWANLIRIPARVRRLVTTEMVTRLPPLRRRVHLLANVAVADSRAVLATLPRRNRVLIPPGVPTPREGAPAELEGRVVLCLASLQPDKDQRTLLAVARSSPNDRFVLAGPDEDPRYAAALRAEAPPNVRFAGAVSDPWPLLKRADVVVLPSTTESAPNVILEALAAGRSVVASRVGDVADMLDHGRLGHLVDPGDHAAFLRAIAHPIAGDRGPAWVQLRYSVAAMARAWSTVYTRVLS